MKSKMGPTIRIQDASTTVSNKRQIKRNQLSLAVKRKCKVSEKKTHAKSSVEWKLYALIEQ